jgi:hypothetical protein
LYILENIPPVGGGDVIGRCNLGKNVREEKKRKENGNEEKE